MIDGKFQGGEGDCFYVVASGEFEVLATQVCSKPLVVQTTPFIFLYN